jgi:hypothetical protein
VFRRAHCWARSQLNPVQILTPFRKILLNQGSQIQIVRGTNGQFLNLWPAGRHFRNIKSSILFKTKHSIKSSPYNIIVIVIIIITIIIIIGLVAVDSAHK